MVHFYLSILNNGKDLGQANFIVIVHLLEVPNPTTLVNL